MSLFIIICDQLSPIRIRRLARRSVATHTHGVAFIFLYKHHVPPGHQQTVLYTNLLGEFEIAVATYKIYPLEIIREKKPKHASEPKPFLSVHDDAIGKATLLAHEYREAVTKAAADVESGGGLN